ncbi:protein-disulfide reductase DsbD domain-containing protein [Salipiger sp.]|uniref:protein-disulfide reductase DsbD domain-containing protein n=1 Tax=Salipiger sp. TaxID=2078585 RepID=UPI003A976A75
MMRRLLLSLGLAVALAAPVAAQEPITAELRPGWRLPDGDHMAALHLTLAPGWKTYWRAPGEAGIPPLFDWSGSRNLAGVALLWPTPHVFWQSGMRSIGYKQELVLPIRVRARGAGDIDLRAEVQLGVCSDVCLPETVRARAVLSPGATRPDPLIAAALASAPLSRGEAAVSGVRCSISPARGGLALRAEIDMPPIGGRESAVVESGQPGIWSGEPEIRREGRTLITETRLMHMDGKSFALDRSKLRFTVLGDRQAVDIQGCD